MKTFSEFSIRSKLYVLVVSASSAALLLASTVFILHDVSTFRKTAVGHMTSVAEVLGANTVAALTFDDPNTAKEILATLSQEKLVLRGCLYDQQGRIFARFVRQQDENQPQSFPESRLGGHSFRSDGTLEMFTPVSDEEGIVGVLYLQSSMRELHKRLVWYMGMVVLVMAFALIAALAVASGLARRIAEPIVQLASTAERVSRERDFSVRVERPSKDELGLLYGAFNDMLSQIELGQSELMKARNQLEIRVQQRTEQLQMANTELQRRMDQRDQVMRELEHSTKIVQLLQEITVAANEADHVESAILVALRRFCEFTGWPVAHAYLPDKERPDELVAADLWYSVSQQEHCALRKRFEGVRITQGDGLPGRVLASSRPAWTSNVGADWNGTAQHEDSETGRNWAFAFPVLSNSEVAAVLEFFLADEDAASEELSDIAIHVGNQLGRVFERQTAASRLEEMHRRVLDSARRAGMAEVATGVLHNVGNVLNSVNVSCGVITDKLRGSTVANLKKAAGMLEQHQEHLDEFLTQDQRGKHFVPFLIALSQQMIIDEKKIREEVEDLRKNIDHIKSIVSVQQSNAGVSGFIQPASLQELIEDAIRIISVVSLRQSIEIVREFDEVPIVNVDKQKILQILVNLVTNAINALKESDQTDSKKLTIRLSHNAEDKACVSVTDNGIGIVPDNLTRIFSHGFTTRVNGHGFGLHSAALFAQEMGGSLTVHSDGLGQGATFTLEIPLKTTDTPDAFPAQQQSV